MYNSMTTIYKVLFILSLLSSGHNIQCQNEFSKWYFGSFAGLDFGTVPPTILINGALGTPEGVATISDNNGNLLFYAQGDGIYNGTHSVMANGFGLFGSQSSAQAVTIVKQPGNANIYYVFTLGYAAMYSVVDMNLAAGMGSVTVKNALLYNSTSERQVVVRHCNGRDAWVVSHEYGSNLFRSYLLNSGGVVLPAVLSNCGEILSGNGVAGIGQLKISPDGKKLAMATASASIPSTAGSGGFHLFDFDAG